MRVRYNIARDVACVCVCEGEERRHERGDNKPRLLGQITTPTPHHNNAQRRCRSKLVKCTITPPHALNAHSSNRFLPPINPRDENGPKNGTIEGRSQPEVVDQEFRDKSLRASVEWTKSIREGRSRTLSGGPGYTKVHLDVLR